MRLVLRAFFVLIFLPFDASAEGGFPYDSYQLTKVSELVESESEATENEGVPIEKRRLWLPALRYCSIVEYTGEYRLLLESHKRFLNDLHNSMPFLPEEGLSLYTKEILVKEGNKKVWMLIQDSVFPYLEKEVEIGDRIKVFYYWLGALREDYIFGINEFQAKVK